MSLTKKEISAIKKAYEDKKLWIGSPDWFGGRDKHP